MSFLATTEGVIALISKRLLHTEECDDAYWSVISYLSEYFDTWCAYVLFRPESTSTGDIVRVSPQEESQHSCLLRHSPIHYFIQKDEWPKLLNISTSANIIFDQLGLEGAQLLCPIVANHQLHGVIILPVRPGDTRWLYVIRSQLEVVMERILTISSTRDLYRQLTRLNQNLEEMVSSQLKTFREEMEMARRYNHEKTLFLSQMSHDLRTPLHVIVGMSTLLREGECDPAEVLPILSSGCDHLDEVIYRIFLSIRA